MFIDVVASSSHKEGSRPTDFWGLSVLIWTGISAIDEIGLVSAVHEDLESSSPSSEGPFVEFASKSETNLLKILGVGVVGRKFEGEFECDKRDSGSCVEVSVS